MGVLVETRQRRTICRAFPRRCAGAQRISEATAQMQLDLEIIGARYRRVDATSTPRHRPPGPTPRRDRRRPHASRLGALIFIAVMLGLPAPSRNGAGHHADPVVYRLGAECLRGPSAWPFTDLLTASSRVSHRVVGSPQIGCSSFIDHGRRRILVCAAPSSIG
jgi:hypothetical protein